MTFSFRLFLFFGFSICFRINALQYLGIVGSNYAGTNSIYANPANMVDSRHKIYVNLAATDLFLGNNAVKWDADYPFRRLIRVGINNYFHKLGLVNNPLPKLIWRANNMVPIDNNREKNINGILEVRGPAIMYSLDNKQSIAITSRGRGGVSLTNVSPLVAKLIQYGPRKAGTVPSGTNLSLAANMNAFAEIGFSYAKNISPNPEEAIKLGITVKRIIGLTNFHTIINNTDYQLLNNVPYPPDITFVYNNVLNLTNFEGRYGFSDERRGLDDFSFKPGYWLGTASPGRGIGLDIGISYEYRPDIHKYTYKEKGVEKTDNTKNKYLYKIGFSLVDFGRVNFNNSTYVSNFVETATNRSIFENRIRIDPLRNFIDGVNRDLNVPAINDLKAFKSNLPTNFQAYFDYKYKENMYVYATWVQNLRKNNSLGMRMPSLISVVPRYETALFDLSMPVSLVNDYQLLTLGLAARLGPVFFGTDNLQGFLNIGKPRGFNLFAGASIPILYKEKSTATDCYYETKESRFKNIFKRKPSKFKGLGNI